MSIAVGEEAEAALPGEEPLLGLRHREEQAVTRPRILSVTRMRWFSALPPGALIDYGAILKEDWGIEDPAVEASGREQGKLLEWGAGLLRIVDQPGLTVTLRHVKVAASTRLVASERDGPEPRALVRVVPPTPVAEYPGSASEAAPVEDGLPLSVSLHDVHGVVRPDDHVTLVWSHKQGMELLSRTIRVRNLACLYLAGDPVDAALSPDSRRILPPGDDGLTQLTGKDGRSAVLGLQGRNLELLPHGTTPRDLERRFRIGDVLFRPPPYEVGEPVAWVVVRPPRRMTGLGDVLPMPHDENNGWWGFGTEVVAMANVGPEYASELRDLGPEARRRFAVGDNLLLRLPGEPKPVPLLEEYLCIGNAEGDSAATAVPYPWAHSCYVEGIDWATSVVLIKPGLVTIPDGGVVAIYRRSPGLVRVWPVEDVS